MPLRIAVIGTGVAGLGAAWRLHGHHELVLFEKNAYVGGHVNTVDVQGRGAALAVDTGFIVFNERNYPLLTRLFRDLSVPTQASDMSFAASIRDGRIEYAGDNLAKLFAQPANLLRPSHYRMLAQIWRFNSGLKRALRDGTVPEGTLGDYLARKRFGPQLSERYLLPMAAAIWSCPPQVMLDFPLQTFARFFDNHGLLDIADRPQWRTVTGGSREYVRRLVRVLGDSVRLGTPVRGVRRAADGVELRLDGGASQRFDAVVFACHADQALALLDDADAGEERVLGAIPYQPNRAYLHTDARLMPRRRAVWSSWNYLAESGDDGRDSVTVSYWMNRLQRLGGAVDYFVTLNPAQPPAPGHVIREITYHHPIYSPDAVRAQQALHAIQGRRRSWFCGAWCGYGFHEDGLRAGYAAADHLTRWHAQGGGHG